MGEVRRKGMRGGSEGRFEERKTGKEGGKEGREEEIQGRKKQFNAVTYGQEAFCSLHGILGIVLYCQFESSLS